MIKKFKQCLYMCVDQRGFTLVELAIVFLIAGLIFAPVYTLILHVTKLEPDEARFMLVQEALAEHLRVTGTLPCPADAAINLDGNIDVNGNGVNDGFEAGTCTAVAPGVSTDGAGANTVVVGALPVANLRAVIGCADRSVINLLGVTADVASSFKERMFNSREVTSGEKVILDVDADGDGVVDVGSSRVEDTRCLNWDYALDEYGSKLIYGVTLAATQPGFDVFDPAIGRFYIRDAAGNLLHDPTVGTGQIYVVVSTGPDQKGAFLRDGTRAAAACGIPFGLDNENCDNAVPAGSGTLPGAVGMLTGVPSLSLFVSALYSDTIGAGHFDDRIDYGIAGFLTEDTFWRWGGMNDPDNDGTDDSRHMMLRNDTRLVIDVNATAPATATDDAVVVNQGRMLLRADDMGDADPSNDIPGGRLEIDGAGSVVTRRGNINVDEKANSKQDILSPLYCYGAALTAACWP